LNFADSLSQCKEYGGQLASIGSLYESNFVTGIRTGKKDAWIGGQFDGRANKQVQWVDGSASRFLNWYPFEPSGDGGEHLQSCVAAGSASLRKVHGGIDRWNDANCKQKKYFICKFCPHEHPSCLTTTDTSTTATTVTVTTYTATTITESRTTTAQCHEFTCGRDCHRAYPRCGWSSSASRCAAGAITSAQELEAGDCDDRTPGPPSDASELDSPSCSIGNCDMVSAGAECQCDVLCKIYDDCCSQYDQSCGEGHGLGKGLISGISFGGSAGAD
jgi:hypothetical protein